MKKKAGNILKWIAAALILIIFCLPVTVSADTFARLIGKGPGSVQKAFDLDKIRLDDDVEVLLVVQSNGEETNATGELYAYTRQRGIGGLWTPWEEKLASVPAKLGRKGMGKTKEGDSKTPCGMFRMNTPFGACEKLKGFPENYIQVTDSMYWDGDSTSPTYNQLVDRNKNTNFSTKASEHLIDILPQYRYCLNIGYNAECKQGAGSALFLHCLGANGENTGGCVAVSEDSMIRILQMYQEKKTVILIANKGGFEAYYVK